MRHSRLSLSFIVFQTSLARAARCAWNFSGVSIVPMILCHSSFDAWTLRMILWVQSFGTWQSAQTARTPTGFL